MDAVQFTGAQSSLLAGKPIVVNPAAVGMVTEGAGSTPDKPVTAIYCGGLPLLVVGDLAQILSKLGFDLNRLGIPIAEKSDACAVNSEAPNPPFAHIEQLTWFPE